MRPEISALRRHLTCPELHDEPSIRVHASIRALRSNAVFIDHEHVTNANIGGQSRRGSTGTPHWIHHVLIDIYSYSHFAGSKCRRFPSSPERLSVLLSRANNGLNMIINIQALTKARRGCKLWSSSVVHMKINGNIYDGLHVVCDRHPAYQSILKTPADFENLCMSQGWNCNGMGFPFAQSLCNSPADSSGTLLHCNVHWCSLKYHRLIDHSQVLWKSTRTAHCAKRCHQNVQ